jgi:hypothetical protein
MPRTSPSTFFSFHTRACATHIELQVHSKAGQRHTSQRRFGPETLNPLQPESVKPLLPDRFGQDELETTVVCAAGEDF